METWLICILHLGNNGLNHSSVLIQFISPPLFFPGDLPQKMPPNQQTSQNPTPLISMNPGHI